MDDPVLEPAADASASSPADNGSCLMLDPALVPDLSGLITEDDTPVDSILAEKQQRLLTHPLYTSWRPAGEGQTFLALANVGYFYVPRNPALVPDVMLALDVVPAGPLETKEGHSYYQWLMGKPPDMIIEIVSDRTGGEDGHKMRAYARQGVPYYVIFDPLDELKGGVLRCFRLVAGQYELVEPAWFPGVELGLCFWDGTFEQVTRTWLRWCDRDGKVIPTGDELAAAAEQRADEERKKAERLAAKLREHGIDPGT
jgi:Uma2 family endonuclease